MRLRNKGIFVFCLLQMACLWASTAQAVILHTGDVNQNETWDNSDTHLITGDIRIPSGVTLTITQGALVEVQALNDDQGGGANASRSELIVDGGRLVIAGAAGNPVTLTSDAASKARGDWQGIRVLNGGELEMRNAVVEYAGTGVDYRQTGAVSGAPVIEDSTLRELSGNGIYVDARGGAQLTLSTWTREAERN